MTRHRLLKAAKLAGKKRVRDIKKLHRQDADHVLTVEELEREQRNMIARFAAVGVKSKILRKLKRCDAGRCGHPPCSAACWWGNRGNVNDLSLQAIRLLKAVKGDHRLRFVTIIDPLRAVPVGELKTISVDALMQTIRRAFRACPALKDAIAFGSVELAIEILPDGRRLWSPHVHLVIVSNATDYELRAAFRPLRGPPDPAEWGKRRWRPVLVKEVTNLANLFDYVSKQTPEVNRSGEKEGKRFRGRDRLPVCEQVEYDRWVLPQPPGALMILRRLRRVRGVLTVRKA